MLAPCRMASKREARLDLSGMRANDFRSSFERRATPPIEPLESGGPREAAIWGARELVVGFCGVLILFFLLAAVIILPVTAATDEESPETLAAQALAVALWDASMVMVVYYLIRKAGGRWRNLGLHSPRPRESGEPWTRGSLLGFICLAYIASIGVVIVYNVVVNALGLDLLKPSQQLTESFFEHNWLVPMIGFSVVIAAPVAEEIFFRGFLFAGLRRRMPFIVAGLLSGAVFSLAHFDLGLVLPFTLVGLILAYTYERTGSLYTSMGVHFIFNAISFLALVFVPGSRG